MRLTHTYRNAYTAPSENFSIPRHNFLQRRVNNECRCRLIAALKILISMCRYTADNHSIKARCGAP